MCHKYGLNFENVSLEYGMIQNMSDEFQGDDFVIFYDPGAFPAVLEQNDGSVIKRNGGVPQEGNLTMHLEAFEKAVIRKIPDDTFEGIAVIDFERWRPIFRQNWGTLLPIKNLSIAIEKEKHPTWDKRKIEHEAIQRFEKYARIFLEETLKTAKKLRPYGKWGYYGYPLCFNMSPSQLTKECGTKTVIENDRLSWLFSKMDVLVPSVYLPSRLSLQQQKDLIEGRINESLRIASNLANRPKILPYYWFKFYDKKNSFLTLEDLDETFQKIFDLGADGIIIWGSSWDLHNKPQCEYFEQYLDNVLGPAVRKLLKAADGQSGNATETETST